MQALKPSNESCCKKPMKVWRNVAGSGNCKQQVVGNLVLLFWRVKDQRHHIKIIIDTIIDVEKIIQGKKYTGKTEDIGKSLDLRVCKRKMSQEKRRGLEDENRWIRRKNFKLEVVQQGKFYKVVDIR